MDCTISMIQEFLGGGIYKYSRKGKYSLKFVESTIRQVVQLQHDTQNNALVRIVAATGFTVELLW